ncbi:hypothetical protein U1Q18_048728 [Sarracenia purpurea var. burkii]
MEQDISIYEAWLVPFEKDRANGDLAEGLVEMEGNILNEEVTAEKVGYSPIDQSTCLILIFPFQVQEGIIHQHLCQHSAPSSTPWSATTIESMVGLGWKAKTIAADSPNQSPEICSLTPITPPPYMATTPRSTFSSPSPTNPASLRGIWEG